jgi:hypothetical protein
VSEQLHAAAILDRLRAAAGTPVMVVHDGKVPDSPDPGANAPYVLVRFVFRQLTAAESPATTSLTFDSVTWQVDVQAHCVGTDARSTRGVKARVRTQLLNWAPSVANRSCTRLKQTDSVTLDPNEAMGVPIEQASDTYRFISQSA